MARMGEVWFELALVAVLVLINAVLSGTELALITLNPAQVSSLDEGRDGQPTADLLADPNRFLATIQVGITLAGFLASAVAAVSLAQPILVAFGLEGGVAETIVIVGVTVVLSFITLVFGELVPKRLALEHPSAWVRVMGRPIAMLAIVLTPVVWVLSVATDAVVTLFGGGRSDSSQRATLRELRDLIMVTGHLPADQHELLLGAFEVSERTIEEVMTPRTDVFTVDSSMRVSDAVAALAHVGFTRAPVTDADSGLDASLGIVSLQDLVVLDPDASVGSMSREVTALPESITALSALRALQAARQPMAFVLDEHGGIEGIVTVEDLLEEVVGEIYDVTDPLVPTPRTQADGSILVEGRFPFHELTSVGIEAPEGDYTTVAGLVLNLLGRIPEEGERVSFGSWEVTVVEMDGQAIEDVRFTSISSSE